MKNNYSVTFVNNSDLPVCLETWQQMLFGISEMVSLVVKENEHIVMSSETGEWFVNNYLFDKDICTKWTHSGYKLGETIGKFRNKPCIKGNYAWLYHDDFQIVYDIVNNLATFSKK
jgi:hypothetical protein